MTATAAEAIKTAMLDVFEGHEAGAEGATRDILAALSAAGWVLVRKDELPQLRTAAAAIFDVLAGTPRKD